MTTQNHSIKIAIITMMCGLFLTGCGGGGGEGGGNTNSSNTETINGIAVPPLPEPVRNNSTLAGVDANNNGVRDDAERMIASLSKKEPYETKVLQIAKLVQRLSTESIPNQNEYNNIQTQIYCLNSKRNQQEKEILSIQDIEYSIINSRERSAKDTENNNKYLNGWIASGGAKCD